MRAYIGPSAALASRQIGANAYAMGGSSAFARHPDLHTVAHEAAHVIQQRRGVSLSEGVGRQGDPYEQHADRVADAVVVGHSAEGLLDQSPVGSVSTGVQRSEETKTAVQRKARGTSSVANVHQAAQAGLQGSARAFRTDR